MKLIIINGPTGSGKSTIAKEFESLFNRENKSFKILSMGARPVYLTPCIGKEYIVIDDQKLYCKNTLDYLKSHAEKVYTFTLKKNPIYCGTVKATIKLNPKYLKRIKKERGKCIYFRRSTKMIGTKNRKGKIKKVKTCSLKRKHITFCFLCKYRHNGPSGLNLIKI